MPQGAQEWRVTGPLLRYYYTLSYIIVIRPLIILYVLLRFASCGQAQGLKSFYDTSNLTEKLCVISWRIITPFLYYSVVIKFRSFCLLIDIAFGKYYLLQEYWESTAMFFLLQVPRYRTLSLYRESTVVFNIQQFPSWRNNLIDISRLMQTEYCSPSLLEQALSALRDQGRLILLHIVFMSWGVCICTFDGPSISNKHVPCGSNFYQKLPWLGCWFPT